ncbi:MAG: 1-deoxy-D-xylulose-5-phosphate synthase [Gammaproteobacteria bacterium]|nr:1-deoxy-D-xylulose-5-phosphate synthase [Gammaproteobacteria bacterium]|tara:strand:+ start:2846 stop:4729 length:1884 start_codon:yes stop_codon:yes gene_type:complete
MDYTLLDKIIYPSDLKKLDYGQLQTLAKELREFLIESVSKTGGHLAAGLGTVELTIALHYIFNTPEDKLIWDIGHQCYPHKILTGRKEFMSSLRKKDGLSGFLKRDESEYDAFGAGHSSTSISAAIGYEIASKINNVDNKVVAIIGDGGLTAGMAFEALSHAGGLKSNILVIINDNEMSISPNVGAMHKYLTRMLTSKTFSSIKESGKKALGNMQTIKDIAKKVEGQAKSLITPGLLFEELGFKYYGPVDGHDVLNLVDILKNLRDKSGPKILHILTKKGKGYKLAEQNPITFHGVTPFNAKTGITESKKVLNKLTYTQIFSKWIDEMAMKNKKLVAITPAMREGSGLVEFEKKYPERYFDVGIAEQHAITFAGGLSCGGIKPIVAIYSTFLQRAYDQVIHDVVVQDLDILLAIDRAGIVGADGETHQGIYDLSFLRILPKVVIMTPSDEQEMCNMLTTGFNHKGLAAVRYPRGYTLGLDFNLNIDEEIKIGESRIIRKGKKIAYLVFGTLLNTVLQVANKNNATVIDMRFVKPIDEKMIINVCSNYEYIFTIEDNVVLGGAGSAVNEVILKYGFNIKIKNIGIPDKTIPHGNQNEILEEIGLDYNGIINATNDYIDYLTEINKKAT